MIQGLFPHLLGGYACNWNFLFGRKQWVRTFFRNLYGMCEQWRHSLSRRLEYSCMLFYLHTRWQCISGEYFFFFFSFHHSLARYKFDSKLSDARGTATTPSSPPSSSRSTTMLFGNVYQPEVVRIRKHLEKSVKPSKSSLSLLQIGTIRIFLK